MFSKTIIKKHSLKIILENNFYLFLNTNFYLGTQLNLKNCFLNLFFMKIIHVYIQYKIF